MIEEFRVHPLYYLLVALSALLLLLLSWTLWETATAGTLLFLGIGIVALFWFISALGTRVYLSQTGLTIQQPLRFPVLSQFRSPQVEAKPAAQQGTSCTIDYRQLYSIDESGRLLTVLTILYYPKAADGLLDLTQIATMTLPVMRNQQLLRQRLEAAISP